MADYSSQESKRTNHSDPRTNHQRTLAGISLFARHRLERFGSWLDVINHKRNPTLSFHPADLSIGHDSLFREQALKRSSDAMGKMFGKSGQFSAYNTLIKKIFPNGDIDKSIDFAFNQIANLAERWSRMDIIGEKRFANVMQLNEQQRHDLARDIANQNRALATIGGATGLAGLAGLLADTLWLLLVSLRTIYQLSMVYGKPLSGKQGIQTAYSILSSSDLSTMQHKQTLLVSLGIASRILSQADTHGLNKTLKSEAKKHHGISGYVDEIDKLFEQFHIDLDKLNLSRFNKLLSFSSVAVGMHFNSILIEEVIGVTQATFAPEYKLAKANTDEMKEV